MTQINIAGTLHNTEEIQGDALNSHVVAHANEILDNTKEKKQSEVNADVDTALADRYTKEETYSKEQLDDLITTPDVNYVSVVATDATTAVTDILPATGEANTIYRVGNWNGTQYDPTMYALYAWNGSAYVCLAVRSFVGEVYDISVNHPDGQGNPTPYADLTAALGTDGANIPVDIRRGGMRIQFVQSSDNKYVQARFLLSGSFTDAQFTNVDNWQGTTSEVKAGSKDLVESGGVALGIGSLKTTQNVNDWQLLFDNLNIKQGELFTIIANCSSGWSRIIIGKNGTSARLIDISKSNSVFKQTFVATSDTNSIYGYVKDTTSVVNWEVNVGLKQDFETKLDGAEKKEQLLMLDMLGNNVFDKNYIRTNCQISSSSPYSIEGTNNKASVITGYYRIPKYCKKITYSGLPIGSLVRFSKNLKDVDTNSNVTTVTINNTDGNISLTYLTDYIYVVFTVFSNSEPSTTPSFDGVSIIFGDIKEEYDAILSDMEDDIQDLTEEVDDLDNIIKSTEKNVPFSDFVNNGALGPNTGDYFDAAYKYTDFIAVKEGDIVKLSLQTSTSVVAMAAYSSNNVSSYVKASSVIKDLTVDSEEDKVIANGINYIRLCTSRNNSSAHVSIYHKASLLRDTNLVASSVSDDEDKLVNLKVGYSLIRKTSEIPVLYPKTKLPCISIIFDDISNNDRQVVQLCDSLGVKCGFAFVADDNTLTNKTDEYLNYNRRGYSIINHSIDGDSYYTIDTYAEALQKMLTAKYRLQDRGFIVNGFVAPSGDMKLEFLPIVELANAWANNQTIGNHTVNTRQTNPCNLRRQGTQNKCIQQIKDEIDAAITNDNYIILYGHTDRFGTVYSGEYDGQSWSVTYSIDFIEDILEYIIQKRNNGEIYFDSPDDCAKYYFGL